MSTQAANERDCAGCQYIETAPVRHAGRWLCRQCPELPADRRKQPTPADTARAGLGDFIRRATITPPAGKAERG